MPGTHARVFWEGGGALTGYQSTRPMGLDFPSGSFPEQQASTERVLFRTRKVVRLPTYLENLLMFWSEAGSPSTVPRVRGPDVIGSSAGTSSKLFFPLA